VVRLLDTLPNETQLHWYRIEQVLGQGGFGITYLARDTNLDHAVAIKEYLPVEFATRAPDLTVRARSQEHQHRYDWGLEGFISEARTLAKFDHPNIVRVHSVFEHNGTAYMVMRYEQGENLHTVLGHRKTLPEKELLGIVFPILEGLQHIHDAGFIHRDIKPDNIYMRRDGSPVLLDFGSARQALRDSRTLTILVAPGYAPFEQYYSSSDQQGPWTDIYGLGATLYRAVSGVTPVDAIARSKGILGSTRDVLVPASEVGRGRYSERFLAAIDHALKFNESERPQSISEWTAELRGTMAPPDVAATANHEVTQVRSALESGTTELRSDKTNSASATGQASPDRPREDGGSTTLRFWQGATAAAIIGLIAAVVLPMLSRMPNPAAEAVPAENPMREQDARLAEREKELENALARLERDRQDLDEQSRINEAEKVALAEERRRIERDEQELISKSAAIADDRRELDEETARLDRDREQLARDSEKLEAAQRELAKEESDLRERLAAVSKREAALAKAKAPSPPSKKTEQKQPKLTREQQLERGLAAYDAGRYGEALGHLEPLARGADAQASFLVGRMYLNGSGVHRDAVEAIRWLKSAAEKGSVSAAFELGVIYSAGNDVIPKDEVEAVKWFRRAAENGDAPAMNALGVMYATGRGVAENHAEATRWYERGAKRGHVDAQTNLAHMYEAGKGVPRNDFLAYAWYKIAAKGGSQKAARERDQIADRLEPAELEQADVYSDRIAKTIPMTPQEP